jgi:hypothetical protein
VSDPSLARRDFLRVSFGTLASVGLGGTALGCGDAVAPFEEPTGWDAGSVRHLLPTASHERILLKASFAAPLARAPQLEVEGRRVEGVRSDSSGAFFGFDVRGLAPARELTLRLRDAEGAPLCDPWPLRTFPAPDVLPERFRLLAYTCAGGPDLFSDLRGRPAFLPTPHRRRLLARALAYRPDAVVANGDHVYWDLHSGWGPGMAASPQAWWAAGYFARDAAVLGTRNEEVLVAAAGPQIAGVYGTLLRSVPTYFVQDDHDYLENDLANEDRRTFPPDRFMREAARATQRLYYPELLGGPGLPAAFVAPDGRSESFGTLRYGRLFEGWLYDCRRFLSDTHFVPPAAEGWLRDRTARSDAVHCAHLPSTPFLWTAGKWGEWYPDVQDADGVLGTARRKPYWPRAWFDQHQRLLAAASARADRLALFPSGDLHAVGAGRILRSGGLDLSANPPVSVLTGPVGTGELGWPSHFRNQRPLPSKALEVEEWVEPIEENGFTLLDFTPEGVTLSLFRWREAEGPDALDRLVPFRRIELARPRA